MGGKLRDDVKRTTAVTRLIPTGGLFIEPNVWYYDHYDVSADEVKSKRKFFDEDEQYKDLSSRISSIRRGTTIGRKFSVYVTREGEKIGNIEFVEYLDNPDGYGKDDFMAIKWIYPNFRNTKYSRYAAADLIHFLFKSGIAKRIYHYTPVKSLVGNYYTMVDARLPCVGKIYPEDGPVQQYFFIRKTMETPSDKFALVEFNGESYLNMDLKQYIFFTSAKTVPEHKIDKWMERMDLAAAEISRLVNEATVRPVLHS